MVRFSILFGVLVSFFMPQFSSAGILWIENTKRDLDHVLDDNRYSINHPDSKFKAKVEAALRKALKNLELPSLEQKISLEKMFEELRVLNNTDQQSFARSKIESIL